MSSLILGIRLSLNDFQRVKIDYVDFQTKIDSFKEIVSKKTNTHKDKLELVYCGNILDDEATLTSSGLQPGVMVHVLQKKEKELPCHILPTSPKVVEGILFAFQALKLNSNYKSALQKLSRPEILEDIISITPGLNEDPIAISLIQDHELLERLDNVDTVTRIRDLHPALAEAANHLVAVVHEDSAASPSTQPSSSGFSYSLEALSEDDEMDSSQSSDSTSRYFTPAQVAAAIASASSNTPNVEGAGITPEMLSQAMQQASAALTSTQNSTPPNENGGEVSGQQLAQQMQQMRELGLTNDALNLQALQISGGNVYAAVDLIFGGAIEPNL
uniref:Ubiquitin-like protein 7 n=1 Tax=Clastoptera arizonana TaxID=38151 RepID=A0A1B6DYT1_9HEMI